MSLNTSSAETTSKPSNLSWLLALVPLLLLGVVMAYLVVTGGGLSELSGPPVEQLKIERITLPEENVIKLEIINDGPQEVTIAQTIVDDAVWEHSITPSSIIPRLGRATVTIPYPWIDQEAHVVLLMTNLGTTFEGNIPVAVKTPQPSSELFLRFGLIGLYVGIVPIALGMLWFPWMRRLSKSAMNFILSLTVGLLVYLAIGTWLDALEFAAELPAFWQGVPIVVLVSMLTLGVLLALGQRGKNTTRSPLSVAYQIATGIGLHNLGEGLAIGAAFAAGQAALGTFLVLGFTLHNITEGVGIAAPVVRQNPGWRHLVTMAFIAGFPAILGTWIGGFAFNPVLATVFLAMGVGAILQVVWEVGKLVIKDSAALKLPTMNWTNLAGFTAGVGIMYFTAFLVKF